jgi:outer membrane protein OmpA-like peptidoglycan-associated protein
MVVWGVETVRRGGAARRTNPWPALVDLFSALLVATFSGFLLVSSEYYGEERVIDQLVGGENAPVSQGTIEDVKREVSAMQVEAARILGELERELDARNLRSKSRQCGDDTCLDLDIHFETNRDVIAVGAEASALSETCATLREAIDRIPPERRREIELVIEGHADLQPAEGADDRDVYLYNWRLSSSRAASVLYQLDRGCGLAPPAYNLVTIGYSNSQPLCEEESEACNQSNRRTTFRLRANTREIQRRVEGVAETRTP